MLLHTKNKLYLNYTIFVNFKNYYNYLINELNYYNFFYYKFRTDFEIL